MRDLVALGVSVGSASCAYRPRFLRKGMVRDADFGACQCRAAGADVVSQKICACVRGELLPPRNRRLMALIGMFLRKVVL